MQYRGGFSVRRRNTISKDTGQKYGLVTLSVQTTCAVQEHTTKTVQEIVGGCVHLEE